MTKQGSAEHVTELVWTQFYVGKKNKRQVFKKF